MEFLEGKKTQKAHLSSPQNSVTKHQKPLKKQIAKPLTISSNHSK